MHTQTFSETKDGNNLSEQMPPT